jgi:HK97 family phage major capsid protein
MDALTFPAMGLITDPIVIAPTRSKETRDVSTALRELEEQYSAKLTFVGKIFKEATQSDGNIDLRKSEALRNLPDEAAARARMNEIEQELKALFDKKASLKENIDQQQRMEQMIRENNEIDAKDAHVHGVPATTNGHNPYPHEVKSLGQLVADDWPKKPKGPNDIWLNKTYEQIEAKAVTMTTANAWAPEVTRTGRFAEFAMRPVQVVDMFPVGATTQAGISYMEEVSQTNAAAETAEGTDMPQSDFAAVERTVLVKKIATYISVTDEQLADVAQVQTLIDQRLRYFVQARLDLQLLQGNGVGPNIMGLLNLSPVGIQTYARGAESNMDAIFRAMALVQVTGRANTTGIIIHPTNWVTIRLSTANGLYLFGPPSESGIQRLWGVPVSVADVVPVNTAIVGDFQAHSTLYTRQGVEVLAGLINDDFRKGLQSIRATLRVALVVYRPTAFASITGLE